MKGLIISALFKSLIRIRDVGSDCEVWRPSILSSPSSFIFSSLSFSLFLLFLLSYSLLLSPLSHHLPLLSPQSSPSHITFFSSHLSSTTLSHSSSHLFCWKTPHLLVSRTLLFCHLLPRLSIPLFFPLMSLLQLLLLLPSSSESRSHLVC